MAVAAAVVLIGAAFDDVEERGAVAAAELVVARVINGVVVVLGAVEVEREDGVGYGLCGGELAAFEQQVEVEVSGEFALSQHQEHYASYVP